MQSLRFISGQRTDPFTLNQDGGMSCFMLLPSDELDASSYFSCRLDGKVIPDKTVWFHHEKCQHGAFFKQWGILGLKKTLKNQDIV